MLVSFYIIVMGGTPVYSPSFPRGGEAATFIAEILALGGTPSLAIAIEHKNFEDTTWATAGSFSTITAAGIASKDATGLKEEIRIKFTATGTDGEGFCMLMPEPAWRPY